MNTVEVVSLAEYPSEKNWAVTVNGNRQSTHRLKQRAEKVARMKAKQATVRPSELIVRKTNNDVSYTQRYDPE